MRQNKQVFWNSIAISYYNNKDNLGIVDSYMFNKIDMRPILTLIREQIAYEEGIIYTRTTDSWVQEWAAHNVLYNLGIAPERTRTVDLSENESRFKLFCYRFFSNFL